MIQVQILSKILQTSNNEIVESNFLTTDYFTGYEKEFDFIQDHIRKYGNVPDIPTFLSNFPNFELVEVMETDRYLVDTIREAHLFQATIPVMQKMSELLEVDSNAAAAYLTSQLQTLQPNYGLGGVDIISQATQRFEKYKERKEHKGECFFESGFPELDELMYGIQREEELLVIVARTNQGKSWVLELMITHIWKLGFNVGYISPEMGADSIGFRFDTLFNHYSNKSLMWGRDDVDEAEYETYIKSLQEKQNRFIVSTPSDFDNQITITKLKNWVRQFNLAAIAIDGITYLSDERGKKGDNKTTSLTNISEDLMSLSVELKIPVLVVVQANRTGVVGREEQGTPELESIRDSDGISHNASKVIAIQQKKNNILEMGIKKQRFGAVGGKLNYTWDINTGQFTYVPSFDDAEPRERTRKKVEDTKDKLKNTSEVF